MCAKRKQTMEEENKNESMPTPPPLPGQIYIRPGIDDRPDYEKTLTEEAKAALKRLAVQQNPRVPEASNERPEVQAARINAEGGSPLTAAAHLDAAVPNLESSFLDLRDPMTAPDGTTPDKTQVRRLMAGFTLGALLFTAPMAALNTVLVPQLVGRIAGGTLNGGVTSLAWLMGLGTVVTFFMNAWVAVGSDHTFGPLGRRMPWIIGGTLLTAASVAILSACELIQLVGFFWLLTLVGYSLVSMPLAAAFGERIPDKFRDRADAWRGIGLTVGQLVGIIVAVYGTWNADASGWDGTTRSSILRFAIWLVVAGIVTLLVLPFEGTSTYMPREDVRKGSFFSQYRPPKGAPKFFVAFVARTFAVAAPAMIAVYQWYLVMNDVDSSGLRGFGLQGTGAVVAMMAVAAFVGSLLGATVLGRVSRAIEDSRIPAVAAIALFVVAAVLPLVLEDTLLAVGLYALIAGFAYVLYDGVSQSLNLATVPDVRSVGRALASFSLANTFGSLLGVIAGAIAVLAFGAYLPMFAVSIVFMLIAGVLTALLK